jgi:muconolactone D-isomerase
VQFLVEIEVRLPPTLPQDERERLLAAELERGVALRRAGSIEGIWRIPGALRNVGIWQASDATELHELISSLPLYPWITAKVTALAEHPIERHLRSSED